MHYGMAIKKIRKNKGYSQKEISGDAFSQATFSNFESGKSDIHSVNFIYILNQLQLSFNEFEFILNGYGYDKSTEIISHFFQLPYNNRSELLKVRSNIENFLAKNDHVFLHELLIICDALLIIEESNDFNKARELVTPIWKRMSFYDQWYLVDIKIINVILYFFEVETSISITEKLLVRLNLYKDFTEASKLKITLNLNLSMLLIKNKMFEKSFENLENLLISKKYKMSYRALAGCYNRLAICSSYMNENRVKEYLGKVNSLLMVYEDYQLLELFKLEFEENCKK